MTNDPAQSLTMMNSPFVIEQAAKWSRHLVAEGPADEQGKLRHIFLRTLGRAPTPDEVSKADAFLRVLAKEHDVPENEVQANARVWQDLGPSSVQFQGVHLYSIRQTQHLPKCRGTACRARGSSKRTQS